MTYAWTIIALVVVLALCWRFLGSYMVAVYEGRTKWLAWIEKPIYKALKLDPEAEQIWQRYAASVIMFSGVALLLSGRYPSGGAGPVWSD
jgi:K+-transporting ATPase ATPase A chain